MKITMIGTGYVGLVTGACFAEVGNDVLCLDVDAKKIAVLNGGGIPIYEPGLKEMVARNRTAGRIRFTTDIDAAVAHGDLQFIAVGTPPGEDGSADLQYVVAAARNVGRRMTGVKVIVDKSTVPVGTADKVRAAIAEELSARSVKIDFSVVSNPEFLKEGDAISDFFKPDRVVVGARSEEARQILRDLYAPLQLSGERLVVTDPRSSELIKYASNTMLAIRISFMNELSRLCHATGADIHSVRLGVGTDSRIGKKFLYAGPGYGGSCFPKDVQALAALGREHGVQMRVAESAHLANEAQAAFLAQLIHGALDGVKGKQITLWGCAFKPETDDIRESPAVRLANALLEGGAAVVAHDPEAGPNFAKHFGNRLTVKERDYDALDGSHALVLLTEWRSYRAPNFAEIKRRLVASSAGASPLLVDARNIWRPAEVLRAGLRYQGIGVAVSRAADRPSQR